MHSFTKQELADRIVSKLRRNFGRDVDEATPQFIFKACALVLRDIMAARQLETADKVTTPGSFIWTISASEIADKITFYSNEASDVVNRPTVDATVIDSNLKLETVAKYEAFKLALHSGTIGINVAEKTA